MKYRKLFALFQAVCVFLALAGCAATGPQFSGAIEANPGQAVIYVYRGQENFGGWVRSRVDFNGKEVAKLSSQSYIYFSVPPGDFELSIIPQTDFQFDEGRKLSVKGRAVAGDQLFYRKVQKQDPARMGGRGVEIGVQDLLERVAPSTADREMRILKMSVQDK